MALNQANKLVWIVETICKARKIKVEYRSSQLPARPTSA